MRVRAVHQFHPECVPGDSITSTMLFVRRLLRDAGFESEIYCERAAQELSGEVKFLREFVAGNDGLLLVHHVGGSANIQTPETGSTPRILVYRGTGPTSSSNSEQLKLSACAYLGAIVDSEYSGAELRAAGFSKVADIPLLVDIEGIRKAPWEQASMAPLRASLNLLFVGPICEASHQLELIEVFSHFLHLSTQPARMILVASPQGSTDSAYRTRLDARINELNMQASVVIADTTPSRVLSGIYRNADIFISMSEHERVDAGLIEAMLFDIPVVAYASPGIVDTMGEGGLLFNDRDPCLIAAGLQLIVNEPPVRRRIVDAQRRNLQRFSRNRLREQLMGFLQKLGIETPESVAPIPAVAQNKPYWQIEGPFDSSYSLAVVNRELGRALSRRGNDIGLRSMEGAGDFVPSADFLRANPDCAVLARRVIDVPGTPDASLRFCYPPHVDDMQGGVRVIHSYGWEETGFPASYVAAFNRKLDLITVLSKTVEKILRDNGVRIPIVVTGGGVDQLLGVVAQLPAVDLRGFRFLHISSCFPRKGVDALLSAFGKAFRDHDDVSLVIKTFPNPHNDIAEQLRCLREQDPEFPHVVLLEHECSEAELVGLYMACHAFVAPSRGEGLGLPMAEAMLFNLPVITTGWGGQLDFCDDFTAWLCDYYFAKSETHMGQTHSVWADPDVDHLARLMKQVSRLTPLERQERTDPARARILRDYSWDRVAQRTEQALHALALQPALRNEPNIGWLSTWNKRCGIAAYSNFLSVTIPSDRLTIFADHVSDADRTAGDSENVIRCWNTDHGEMLDHAYEAIVARGIDVVVIQYNFGFYLPTTLARLIERLKQAGIGVHCFFHATGDVILGGQQISLGDIVVSLAKADRLYVHSVQDLNRLKKFNLVSNATLFPQGVVASTPAPSVDKRNALGLQGKRVIAGYGFLLPHKGIQQLIRTFAQLEKENGELHLLLVNALYPIPASAEEKDACTALIAELGLTSRVTLMTEFLPDAECLALLQLADLIVYPYQRTQESSSAAVRMGLATGRPVAVTPLSIFDDVADAVHTLPGTGVDVMADGIRQLLSQPEVIAEQAARTTQWLSSRLWPSLSIRLLNIIDGIANPLPHTS
jgi:glycosyltransferase involved in cell wall biosynthesis